MFDDDTSSVPIAVVGLGSLMPGSVDVPGFWRSIVEGRDQITDVPAERWLVEDHYDPDPAAPDKTYVRRGAFLPAVDFDPMEFGIMPNNLQATDSAQLLSLLVAGQTFKDACGDRLATMDRDRIGVVLGAATLPLMNQMSNRLLRPQYLQALRESGVPEPQAQAICDRITDTSVPWSEATFPGALTNVVAGRIANRFDLHGLNHTTDAACASSFAALSTAVTELVLGRADLMLTGGVDTSNEIGSFVCFSKTPALSSTEDCRPFSADADGTMLGEGLAMLALRRLADAERDGDRIYAVIRGVGASSDGGGTAIYAPVPAGQVRALRRAYREAGYGPETVELVEAHGTGTRAGDVTEFAALREVFTGPEGPGSQFCALGSIKSQLGHTKCAAGAAGLLKVVLALQHKVLPPTIKVERPQPELGLSQSPFYLNTRARPWVRPADHPRRASVSSFGFGGTNFHVTVEEYVPDSSGWGERALRSRSMPSELLLLSADSPESLLAGARDIDPDQPLAALARLSQQRFRSTDAARMAVVARDTDDFKDKLAQACAVIAQRPGSPFAAPGMRYAAGTANLGRIAFLFPGQGAQQVGMGADLAMHLPSAQRVWDRHGTREFDGRRLHQVVFPPPVFTDAERAEQQAALTSTEWAQPALATHSLALLDVLGELGLRPDCLAGHSFGELVALHAAGVLDADELLGLARYRGELMRDAAAQTPGAMLAVPVSREQAEGVIVDLPGVWLANLNAPDQIVLSGRVEAIEEATQRFAGMGCAATRLSTATAFHSPVVAAATEPLADYLRELRVGAPRIPVYGNADADVYPADPGEVRRRIAGHLASPVLFEAAIEAMYAAGVRTFVEVGAGSTLTGLARRILSDREHLAVGLERAGRDGVTGLHEALGQLAVGGADLDYTALWEEYGPPVERTGKDAARMTVQIDGGNYGRLYPPPGGTASLPAPNPAPAASSEHAPAPGATTPVAAALPAAAPVGATLTAPAAPTRPPTASPGPAVAAGPHGSVPTTDRQLTLDSGLLALIEETQRQTTEAHADYQRQTTEAYTDYQRQVTESHVAYLRLSESSLAALLGNPPPTAPQSAPTPPAQTPLPMHAPLAPVPLATQAPPLLTARDPRTDVLVSPHSFDAPSPTTVMQPAPTVSAPPPGPLAAPDTPDLGELQQRILTVVAERTGYPAEILNLDMQLEADLGIDSIKRVEILSAFRGHLPDLPQDAITELSKARTLRDVVDQVHNRIGAAAPSETPVSSSPEPRSQPVPPGPVTLTRSVLRAVPAEAAGLAMAGLFDGPIAVTDDGTGVAQFVAEQLRSHGCSARVEQSVSDDVAGVILLDGLAQVGSSAAALAVQRGAFRTVTAAAPRLAAHGGLLVAVQDTGGDFGLSGRQGDRAWLGGLAGLARTAAREWPKAAVKAIDCERGSREPSAVAQAIVRELMEGGADLDVGLSADGARCTLRVSPEPLPVNESASDRIGPESVIVATGGARGVTAAALRALARRHQPHLVLLGRTPLTAEPPELSQFTEELSLTRALAEREPAAVPAALSAQARRILAVREIRETISSLEQAGSPVRYLPLDARDGAAVSQALEQVRAQWGPVTGIVHGAGVLADKLLTDKTDEQVDQVIGTKVDGLRALLDATVSDPIRMICLFSSVAGVFGNAGQSDYAVANEVLGQVASVQQAGRPDCLVRSIAWGPWQGGMVSPAVAELLAGQGAGLIALEVGADAFVAELGAAPAEARVCLAAESSSGSMVSARRGPASAEIHVDGNRHPYLADHAVRDMPVLPIALAVEWMARMADAWRPGTDAVALRDLRVLRKIALPDLAGGGHRLTMRGTASADGTTLQIHLQDDGSTANFRAEASMGRAPRPSDWHEPAGLLPDGPELYDGFVHFHGPRFRAVRSLSGTGEAGAVGEIVGLRALGWPGEGWRIDPAALDAALQLASLWAVRPLGGPVLPMAIDKCRVFQAGPLAGPARCLIRTGEVSADRARCDAGVIDGSGRVLLELLGIELVRRPA